MYQKNVAASNDPKILKPEVKKTIELVTGQFEGGGTSLANMYVNLSCNDDGMGISVGVRQENFGQGTLQTILRQFISKEKSKAALDDPFLKRNLLAISPTAEMNKADAIKESLKWQHEYKTGYFRILPAYAEAWRELLAHPTMIAIQNEHINIGYNRAVALAKEWGVPTVRGNSFFFDVITQNGSMCGITPDDVHKSLILQKQESVNNSLRYFVDQSIYGYAPQYRTSGDYDYLAMTGTKIIEPDAAIAAAVNQFKGVNILDGFLYIDCRATDTTIAQTKKILGQNYYSYIDSILRTRNENPRPNYVQWQPEIVYKDSEAVFLFEAAFQLSKECRRPYMLDTFNRKATLAVGRGRVHGKDFGKELKELFGF